MRIPSLVLLLALAGCGPKRGPSGPVAPVDDASVMLFVNSGFSWCDARFLAHMWGVSPIEAKAAGGRMLQNSGDKAVFMELDKAHGHALESKFFCPFHETGYTYDDAEAIARLMGTDVSDAKAWVEYKIAGGSQWAVDDELKMAAGDEYYEDEGSYDDPVEKFWDSQYNYCDARILAHFWSSDVYDAKVKIGQALLDGTALALDEARGSASAAGMTCDFWETGYEYEDAQRLANAWGQSTSEVKGWIATKAFWGNHQAIRDSLAAAGGR